MRIEILSLFPAYFRGPLDESILKRAQASGLLDIRLVDIRSFSEERFHKVDDRPYGGGPGMVMMADPVVKAIRSCKTKNAHVVYMSPQGKVLDAAKCKELASFEHLILVSGHYEGIDERAIQLEVDEEISIGDYVLTNGCLASLVVIDTVSRFIPGVLGDERASQEDSFEKGLLDCPHYTRPEVYEGLKVPEQLLSGNHKEIAHFRWQQAANKTKKSRPDIWMKYLVQEPSEPEGVDEKTSGISFKEIVLQVLEIDSAKRFYEKLFSVKAVKTEGAYCITLPPLAIRLVEDSQGPRGVVKESIFHVAVMPKDFVRILKAKTLYEEKFSARLVVHN